MCKNFLALFRFLYEDAEQIHVRAETSSFAKRRLSVRMGLDLAVALVVGIALQETFSMLSSSNRPTLSLGKLVTTGSIQPIVIAEITNGDWARIRKSSSWIRRLSNKVSIARIRSRILTKTGQDPRNAGYLTDLSRISSTLTTIPARKKS